MLSRRHLRTKVLQSVYSFIQSGNSDIANGEKQLLKSIDKLYELYIYQLSLLIEIVDFASNRLEENKKKYIPTDEDLKPNTRFVDNKFILQIKDNKDYRRYHDKLKINWADDQEMIRKFYKSVKESKSFKKYMEEPSSSYEDDKAILIKIIKKIIAASETLEHYYDDKSVFWAFDVLYLANMMVLKTIKMYQEDWDENQALPEIFKVAADGEMEDRKFILELFRKSIVHYEKNKATIAEKAKNWELDRIAIMDILLIDMALVELTEFPSIPIKVSMNEYIEISKYFSSSKSKIFINGILDKLVAELKKDKKINKVGRGLIEN
jgi:N utilization substance protein B